MSYTIEGDILFPGDTDALVKHNDHVYIKLSDEIFVPLMFDDDEEEYYIDRETDILRKINVDHRKIDDFVKLIGETMDRITVMIDPDDPDQLEEPVTSKRDSISGASTASTASIDTADYNPDDDDALLAESEEDEEDEEDDSIEDEDRPMEDSKIEVESSVYDLTTEESESEQESEHHADTHTYRVLSEFIADSTIRQIFDARGNWKPSNGSPVDLFIREGLEFSKKDKSLYNVRSTVSNMIDPESSQIQKKNTHHKFVDKNLQYLLPEQVDIRFTKDGYDPETYRNFIKKHGVVILKPVDGWGGNLITVHENYESFRDLTTKIYKEKQADGFNARKDPRYGYSNRLNWVVEEYLQGPMLYKGRKFHGRVYFVFHVDSNGKKHAYLFDKIRIAVAEDPYVEGDYDNKKIHDTHFVLKEEGRPTVMYLIGAINYDAYTQVNEELKLLFTSIARNMDGDCYPESKYCYQVFAADIMVTGDGHLRLLEINNKPGFNKDLGTAGELLKHIMYHIVDPVLPPARAVRKPLTSKLVELDLSTVDTDESLISEETETETETVETEKAEIGEIIDEDTYDSDDEGVYYIVDEDDESSGYGAGPSAFGTGDTVILEEVDEAEETETETDADLDDEDLLEIIVHETGAAVAQVVRTSYNINRLADLISARYEITDDLTVERLRTVLLSMVHNHLAVDKFGSIGEKLHSTRGLPSWIIPVVCSTLVVEGDQTSVAHYHNSHKKGGCYVLFDNPRDYKTRGTLMPLMDNDQTAPGQWEQAGMHHGINVIRQMDGDGCTLDEGQVSNAQIQREPGPEYMEKIVLTPTMQSIVNTKKGGDRAEGDRTARMRNGVAFANAVVEPGAIARIETTTKEHKKLKVIGFMVVTDTGNQFVPLKCGDKDGEEVFHHEITKIIEERVNDILNDETLVAVHNMRPVDDTLKAVFHMDRDDIGIDRLRKVRDIIDKNHPEEVYVQEKGQPIVRVLATESKGARRSWADHHKQQMLSYTKYNRRVTDHGLNHDKLVDHGELHNMQKILDYVKHWGALPEGIANDPGSYPTTGVHLDNPRAIQYSNGRYYYGHDGKHYLKDDYKHVLRYEVRKMMHRAVVAYPNVNELEDRVRIMSSFHQRQKEESNKRTDRRLADLVIKIAQNVPRASMVTAYMNRLMEEDTGLYLEYLDTFTDMGLVTYNHRLGRYITTETGEMIICICHKTYLERGHFIDKEFFEYDGQCKYCMATLRVQEQVVDYTGMIDRDIYVNDQDQEEHNPYVNLEMLYSVILQNLEDFMSKYGWALTDADRDHIMSQLKDDDNLILNPYGEEVRKTSIDPDNGDLRSLIQQIDGDLHVFSAKKKKGRADAKTGYIQKDYTFNKKFPYGSDDKSVIELDMKKLIKAYFKSKFSASKISTDDLFDTKNSEFRRVMRDVGGEVSPTESSVYAMSYFTLPILREQAINITTILSYIASFLELKYGTKMSDTRFVTDSGDDIAAMIQSHVTTGFVHHICNEFSELMNSKYHALVHMLHQMGPSRTKIKDYHTSIQRMYESVRDGSKCFNPEFTKFYEIYLRIRSTQPFFEYLEKRYESELKERRVMQKSQYANKEIGKKVVITIRNGDLMYNVSTVSLNVDQHPDSLAGYERCRAAARQKVYTSGGYLSELSQVYRDATAAVKDEVDSDLPAEDTEAYEYGMLTAVAHEAYGMELMDTTGDKDHVIPVPLGDSIPPASKGSCTFLADELRKFDLKTQTQFHEIFMPYDGDLPQSAVAENVGRLIDRSAQHATYADLWQKIVHLKDYYDKYTEEEEDDGVKGIFEADRSAYVNGVIPPRSARVIKETHNERLKKALDLRNIHKYTKAEAPTVPDILGPDEDDPEALYPWGDLSQPDIILRSATHCQNLGRFLVMLIRWIGVPLSPDEMESMQNRIRSSREGNVWGANKEFKIETDQISSLGYVLEDLFALKKQVSETEAESEEAGRQWDYLSQYEELYQISYNEYKNFIAGLPEGATDDIQLEDPESPEAFLRLITTALRADIVKHMNYITRGTRSPLTRVVFTYHAHHKQFIEVLTKMLDVLAENAGPEIIDPDRNKIDEMYELRFREYASKKKIVVPRDKSKQPSININSQYVGQVSAALDTEVELDVDDDYDPMSAELVEDEEPEEEPGQYELLDGLGNYVDLDPEYVDEDALP